MWLRRWRRVLRAICEEKYVMNHASSGTSEKTGRITFEYAMRQEKFRAPQRSSGPRRGHVQGLVLPASINPSLRIVWRAANNFAKQGASLMERKSPRCRLMR
jgi:hypothetical protein